MATTVTLARIKPYNPKIGHVMQQLTASGIRFEEKKGWYVVNEEQAAYLRTVHMQPEDPNTPLAFEVVSKEQADEIAANEFKQKVMMGRLQPSDVVAGANARDVSGTGPTGATGATGAEGSAVTAPETSGDINSGEVARASRGDRPERSMRPAR